MFILEPTEINFSVAVVSQRKCWNSLYTILCVTPLPKYLDTYLLGTNPALIVYFIIGEILSGKLCEEL